MKNIKGIDLKKFKKYILKDIGKKCLEYNWDCLVCRSWRLYEELEAYQNFINMLDNIGCDKKKINENKITD